MVDRSSQISTAIAYANGHRLHARIESITNKRYSQKEVVFESEFANPLAQFKRNHESEEQNFLNGSL